MGGNVYGVSFVFWSNVGTPQLFFSALIHVIVILMPFLENPSNDLNPNLGWLFRELNFPSLKTQVKWMKSLLNFYGDRRIVCFFFYCIMFPCSRRNRLLVCVFHTHVVFFAERLITELSQRPKCYRYVNIIPAALT